MELVRLKLENFLSFKNLEHRFIKEPVLIKGKNLTEPESKENNGAGKSTIEAGIAYAILADSLREKTLDRDLVLWGQTEASVELDIYCPVRKETLNIRRTIRTKGSSTLTLTINEVAGSVQYATVNDGNAFILDWIGISASDIKSFFILNKENYKSFIRCSNTEKLAFINRFIKADKLADSDATIKLHLQPLNEKREALLKEVAGYEGEVLAYQNQLEAERNRDFEEEKENRLTALDNLEGETIAKYDECNRHIEDYKAQIQNIRNNIADQQGACNELSELVAEASKVTFKDKYAAIEKESEACKAEFRESSLKVSNQQIAIRQYETQIGRLTAALEGAIRCPHCGKEFILNGDEEPDAIRKDVKALDRKKTVAAKELVALQASLDAVRKSLEAFTDKFDAVHSEENAHTQHLRQLNNRLAGVNASLDAYQRQITSIETRIEIEEKAKAEYEKQIQGYEEQLAAIAEEQPVSRVAELEDMLKIKNKQLQRSKERLETCGEEIAKLTKWGLIFKEFRMNLACEQLKLIQDFANFSLQQQHSELRLAIDGFKANRKGEVKSEINVLVINGDGEYRNYWSFSGGERARIDMALIQAFQDMINSTNKYGGLHFLMVDEVLEGTDPLGLFLLMESMQSLKQSVYVISHVMQIRAGITTFTVVKENGVSYIE